MICALRICILPLVFKTLNYPHTNFRYLPLQIVNLPGNSQEFSSPACAVIALLRKSWWWIQFRSFECECPSCSGSVTLQYKKNLSFLFGYKDICPSRRFFSYVETLWVHFSVFSMRESRIFFRGESTFRSERVRQILPLQKKVKNKINKIKMK